MDYTELQLLFIGKNFGNHSVKFEISIEPLVFQIVLVIPQAYPASFAVVNGNDSVDF